MQPNAPEVNITTLELNLEDFRHRPQNCEVCAQLRKDAAELAEGFKAAAAALYGEHQREVPEEKVYWEPRALPMIPDMFLAAALGLRDIRDRTQRHVLELVAAHGRATNQIPTDMKLPHEEDTCTPQN